MMDKLITGFDYQLTEPACAPGAGRYGVQVTLPNDISAVFPYLNATLDDTWYDHENHILIGGEDSQKYAFRPNEIRVAGIADPSQARQVAGKVVDLVNRVWQERDGIAPRFSERKLPTVVEIFNLLPKTNCQQCRYATCLVFAADLREGKAMLEQCPPLSQPEYAENKERITALFSSD